MTTPCRRAPPTRTSASVPHPKPSGTHPAACQTKRPGHKWSQITKQLLSVISMSSNEYTLFVRLHFTLACELWDPALCHPPAIDASANQSIRNPSGHAVSTQRPITSRGVNLAHSQVSRSALAICRRCDEWINLWRWNVLCQKCIPWVHYLWTVCASWCNWIQTRTFYIKSQTTSTESRQPLGNTLIQIQFEWHKKWTKFHSIGLYVYCYYSHSIWLLSTGHRFFWSKGKLITVVILWRRWNICF